MAGWTLEPAYAALAQDFGSIDPMMGMIVRGEKIPLRSAPEKDAEEMRALSWDVVQLVDGLQPGAPFQKVRLADEI